MTMSLTKHTDSFYLAMQECTNDDLQEMGDHYDEIAARRWFKRHPLEGLKLALEAARGCVEFKAVERDAQQPTQ